MNKICGKGAWVQLLELDTELFGFVCGELFLEPGLPLVEDITRLTYKAEAEDIVHITAKLRAEEVDRAKVLQSAGFRLMISSMDLEKKIFGVYNALPDRVSLANEKDLGQLMHISRLSFASSTRFHFDDMMGKDKATELYVRWIKNLLQDPGVVVLTHLSVDIPDGFITVRLDDKDTAHIDLYAVAPEIRHNGIGNMLLMAAEASVQGRAQKLSVRTECINYAALNVYTRAGFKIAGCLNAFHWSAAKEKP